MEFPSISYSSIEAIVEKYINESPDSLVTVVLIGANNGETKDFLSKYILHKKVQAVLVEPVTEIFRQLKHRFSGKSNLFFEHSAVYKRSGKKLIYKLKQYHKLPTWTVGLGSFSKNVIMNHSNQVENIGQYIVSEKVNCITFKGLVSKYKLTEISILQIDTEGYDYEILKTIDFKAIKPDIIIAEYLHLSFYQYFSVINLLEEQNYWVSRNEDSLDLIAVDREILY